MNLHDPKYKSFALVREMLETPGLIGKFDFQAAADAAAVIRETGKLFLTGEGSSRIFPAKNLICEILRLGVPVAAATEGARQAHEYDLSKFVVFGASNSGKTKELISLFTQLGKQGHAEAVRADGQQSLHAGDRFQPLLHAALRQGRRRGGHEERRGTGLVLSLAARRRWEPSSPLVGQPAGGGRQGPGKSSKPRSTRR